ncbi:MAG: N-acetyltransferase family protein [Candidatus Auribacterota bacterium]|jgi:phosphinothricin acetyltransferase|nr:N-acetyltransferase family protein [Candidatus Auribacterota bacterium]
MKILFEAMTEKHGVSVMEIFNYYVEHGFSAYPEKSLPVEFFAKFIEMTKGYPAFVMIDEATQEIVGFCFLRPYNPFPVFKKTAEISYFIKPEYTGKGLGTIALEKLQSEAKNKGIKFILASISSRNEQSLSFHKKNGFFECGKFSSIGEKKGVAFDVIWMQKELV